MCAQNPIAGKHGEPALGRVSSVLSIAMLFLHPFHGARLPSSERGALGTSACFSEEGFRYAMRLRYGLVARRCASVSYRIRECNALSDVSRVFTLLHSPVRSRSE